MVRRNEQSHGSTCAGLRRRSGPAAPLHETAPATLEAALPAARSAYGEGCNNEGLRVFSDGGRAEGPLGALTAAPAATGTGGVGWAAGAPQVLEQALEHMGRCTVGVLERCNDTRRAVEAAFPWLAPFELCERHVNVGGVAAVPLTEARDDWCACGESFWACI